MSAAPSLAQIIQFPAPSAPTKCGTHSACDHCEMSKALDLALDALSDFDYAKFRQRYDQMQPQWQAERVAAEVAK